MTSRDLFLEDFSTGQRFESATMALTEADIIEFAKKFDPQYFHLDPAAAAGSAFGGLVASGLHTICITMRLFFDLNLWERAIMASPGMDEIRFLKPVRPGDVLRSRMEVAAVRRSTSKPDRGIVTMRHELWNQSGERVFSGLCLHMLRARG
jgi:acyl dehydratase